MIISETLTIANYSAESVDPFFELTGRWANFHADHRTCESPWSLSHQTTRPKAWSI